MTRAAWIDLSRARTALIGVGLLVLCACGGGGADPAPTGAPTAAAPIASAEGAESVGELTQGGPGTPSRAKRNFRAQSVPRGPRHDALAAAVDPAHPEDPWPSEQLAAGSERALEYLLLALASAKSDGEFQGLLTRGFHGAADGVELEGSAVLQHLRSQLVGIVPTNGGVVARVHAIFAEEPRAGDAGGLAVARTRVQALVGPDPVSLGQGQHSQVELELSLEWRIARRLRLHRLEIIRSVARSGAPLFRDLTEEVLESSSVGESDLQTVLGLGALEAAGRTDRMASLNEILLGMHGLAVGDIDGDGDEDLVVGRASGQPNLCFVNDAGTFREEGGRRGLDVLESTGGMLIVDLDGDGARDLVFGRGPEVCVAWNDGRGHFGRSVPLEPAPTEGRARVYSLCAADVDGDGDLDLYDTRYFKSGGYGAQAPTPYDDATNGAPNVFWRNLLVDIKGDGQAREFRDDTAAVGLDVDNDRFSLSAVFDDFDGDEDLDLYVTNDFGRNTLYLWEGESFRQAAAASGLMDKAAGMGVSVADVNLDGHRDLVVSNMHSPAGMRVTASSRFQEGRSPEDRADFMRHARGNSLFRGLGDGKYEDVTEAAGTGPGGWAWGARFVDWDRDGLMDMAVPNGFLSGRRGPDLASFFWRRVVAASPRTTSEHEAARYLDAWGAISFLSQFGRQDWNARERTFSYGNRGSFRFSDDTLLTGLGFQDDGRALAEIDLDQDGRVDLVQRNRTSPILRVFRGVGPAGRWASFRLRGRSPNVDAIGAELRVTAGGVVRRRRVTAGDGFLAGSSLTLRLGFEDDVLPEVVEVRWPDGSLEGFAPTGDWLGGAWTLEWGQGTAAPLHRGRPSQEPTGSASPAPLPGGVPGPERSFVPLFEEIPMGAWRVPSFGDVAIPAREQAGEKGLAVLLWRRGDAASEAALVELNASAGTLSQEGLELRALTLDGVREQAAARVRMEELAPGIAGGRLDRPSRAIVEMMLARTLSPYEDLPLPIALGLDGQGDLCWMHVGAVSADALRDAAMEVAGRARPDSMEEVLGGHWSTGQPRRGFAAMASWLEERGLSDVAWGLRAREAEAK